MGTLANIGRLRQISAVVARHGLGHYMDRRRSVELPPEQARHMIPTSARRFRAVLEELGPTFIKFGQVLSTRADLLPQGFAEALRGLQDDCPPLGPGLAQRAVEEALGKPIGELFSEFDDTPIASASIAQVHRAVTRQGREVAVKVQRPGVREMILRDLDLLTLLAQLAEAIVAESGLVTPRAIVEEFESAFLTELDFVREARTMQRFAANARRSTRPYIIPEVFEELSSRTVLTMEFIRGAHLSQLGPEHDRKAIASNLAKAAFEQLFEDGLFHADPHPGNTIILPDNRVALIDFGSVGQVSYAMRETLLVLVVSVGMRDADTVARLVYRVGIPNERVSLHRLRDEIASLFDEFLRDRTTLANIEASRVMKELLDLVARFKVRMPSEYALIARAAMTAEGIVRELDPDLEVLEIAQPYIRRLISKELSPPELGDEALKNLMRARSFMRELPLTASQLLMDLETGKLQVQIANPQLEAIARNIDALGVTIFMGLIAGGMVTGAFFLIARYEYGVWWIPLAALSAAGMLLGGAMGRYLLAPRLRKISIGRWLTRRRRR